MIVVNHNNGTHIFEIVPRFYPSGVIDVELTKEGENTKQVLNNVTYYINNGKLEITLGFTFQKKDRYAIKIYDNEVIYKGRIFATDDNIQEYQENTFIYV